MNASHCKSSPLTAGGTDGAAQLPPFTVKNTTLLAIIWSEVGTKMPSNCF